MREAGVSDKLVVNALGEMKTDRVVPFRFIAAARYDPKHEAELEQAMFRTLKNQPPLLGTTALVVDTSPSMWMARLTRNSDMDRFEAAAGLAILLRETAERANVYAFNEKHTKLLRDMGSRCAMRWQRPRTTGVVAVSPSPRPIATAMTESSSSPMASGTSRTPPACEAMVRAIRKPSRPRR